MAGEMLAATSARIASKACRMKYPNKYPIADPQPFENQFIIVKGGEMITDARKLSDTAVARLIQHRHTQINQYHLRIKQGG
jgi:hypothetical protein